MAEQARPKSEPSLTYVLKRKQNEKYSSRTRIKCGFLAALQIKRHNVNNRGRGFSSGVPLQAHLGRALSSFVFIVFVLFTPMSNSMSDSLDEVLQSASLLSVSLRAATAPSVSPLAATTTTGGVDGYKGTGGLCHLLMSFLQES